MYCDIIPVMRVAEIADLSARWLLTAFAFFIPFFVIPAPWALIAQDKMLLLVAGLTLTLAAFVIARITAGTLVIPRHPLLLASVLLPIAYVASALGSSAAISSYVSGFGTTDTVAAIVLLFATLALFALLFSEKQVLYPFLALVGGVVVVVLFQIARLIVPTWLSLGGAMSGSASSVVGSWHDLGIFAALFVFFALVFVRARESLPLPARIALGVLGLSALGLLFIIGFADLWYALGALALLYSVYTYVLVHFRDRHSFRIALKRASLALLVAAIALTVGFYSSILLKHLPSSVQISQLEVRPSWQSTYSIGEKVFTNGDALFGSGPDTFSSAWGKWKPLSVNQTDYWTLDFHAGIGLIPTAFITAGALGAIAWFLLLLVLLYRLLIHVRRSPEGNEDLESTLLAAAVFLVWFHVFYAPGAAVSIVLFMLLGLLIASDKVRGRRSYTLPLNVNSMWGVLGVLAMLIVSAGVLYAGTTTVRVTVSDLFVAKASTDYAQNGSVPKAVALVQRALFIYPENAVAHRAAVQVGLLQLQELLSKGANAQTAELRATLERIIAEGLRAVAIDSTDYQNWLALASLYQNLARSGVSGAYEQAFVAYKKAAATSPTNPIPLINAGQLALAQGDAKSSVSYLDQAIALKPNLAVAYFLRSQAKGSLGEFPSAIEDAKAAISLAREDALGWYNLGTLFYASEDYSNAALALSQAASLQNDYANALFVLSLALQKQNNYPAALSAMQRVAELNPDNAMVKEALSSLKAASEESAAPTPRKQ